MGSSSYIDLLLYQDLLWALEIEVGGQRRLFLLDTAAGITTLDRALAKRLGVRTTGRLTAQRMTGEVLTLDLAHDVELGLGDRSVAHGTVGVLDLAALLPPGWPPVGGAIGLPTFDRIPVTIDLSRRRLTLDAEPPHTASELRVRPERDGPSLDLFVEVRGQVRPLWLELDTGNTGPVILSPEAIDALGWDTVPSEATLDVIGMGPVHTPIVQKAIRYDGNLGASFFATRPLTLDLTENRAWVSRD